MIFIPYFGMYSVNDKIKHREDGRVTGCRCKEMIYILYLYLRYFIDKNEHICIIDNAGPIDINWMLDLINESHERLNENNFIINKDVKLHIKRFNELCKEGEAGVNRRVINFLKIAYLNDENMFAIDSDALIAYDIISDFKNCDFGCFKIDYNERSIASFVTYISNKRLKEKNFLIPLDKYIDYIQKNYKSSKEQHLILCSEGAYFKNFCYGDIKEISSKEKTIHERPKQEFIDFIKNNPINNKYIDKFVQDLENNKTLI